MKIWNIFKFFFEIFKNFKLKKINFKKVGRKNVKGGKKISPKTFGAKKMKGKNNVGPKKIGILHKQAIDILSQHKMVKNWQKVHFLNSFFYSINFFAPNFILSMWNLRAKSVIWLNNYHSISANDWAIVILNHHEKCNGAGARGLAAGSSILFV